APQQPQGSGGQGGFFVPGASQAPVASATMAAGSSASGYPAPPMQQQQQYPQPPQYPQQQQYRQPPQYPQQQYPQQQQQQMDGITQQFSQMGVGQSQQDYQTALLGGKPPITALDEAPPPIRLPPGSTCVPSPFAQCPASHKRSTLNAIPRSDKLLRKTKLPFGLVLTPFKSQEPGEAPLPVASDIVRCRRCRTYINPFVQFVEGGRRWKCNLCGLSNDVPLSFDYDSATQTQKDRWSRVDLNHSVVEFVAPIEYMMRPPMPPVYVFVIDVSYAAVQIGAPGAIARTVQAALDDIPNADGRTKVAFIAVDTALHFFQLRAGSPEPQQLVVGDLEEVFLPSPTDLLVNLQECREGISNLLERFESMFQSNHAVGNALCPAVQAVLRLLGGLGGKVVVVQASAPTIGEGRVEPRAEGKDLGTPRESELLRAQNGWYKNMAAECSRPQIAFDMVFMGQQPMGMETVSSLARYTGGSVFHYPTFMAARRPETERLTRELRQHLAADIGLEAVLRIRASKGLRMAAYYGNFFLRSLDLLALPNVTPNHSYGVDLEIEETLTAPVVYFQTALLHTTAQGERRIRVSTLAVPTTENIHTVFHHADQVAIASLLAKKAVDRALVARLEDAREALQHKALEIIAAFKTECTQASSGATTQLQIPHALRLLPLLTLASLKHTSLRAGNTVSVGARIAAMNLVLTLPPEMGVQPYSVARMFALHDMPPQAGYADESGAVVLPPRLGLSAEALAPRGIYLLYSGVDSFLWFSRDASAAQCHSLLNEPNVGSIPNGVITFPNLGDAPEFELNQRTNAILRQLSSQSHDLWSPMTFICKEDGEPLIRLMLSQRLVEDMDPSAPSYQQFLGQLRDKINRGNF
ncbi:COPII subunit, partial [Coemansia guatemalensis]